MITLVAVDPHQMIAVHLMKIIHHLTVVQQHIDTAVVINTNIAVIVEKTAVVKIAVAVA
jgi:hypothetical protein